MEFFIRSALVASLLGASVAHAEEKSGAAQLQVRLSTKGNDIAFDQAAIQVPFGKKVQLKFSNEAAKGSEILHNVAILKPGTTDEVLKELQANGYDIAKMRTNKSVIVMTKALEPGAEETLEFLPSEPGFYPYICLMAGHADMLGMKGLLNVKK